MLWSLSEHPGRFRIEKWRQAIGWDSEARFSLKQILELAGDRNFLVLPTT
jgi:hypothetical protein